MKIKDQLHKINFRKYAFVLDIALFMIITYVFHKLWWQFSTEIKSINLISNTADWLATKVFETSFWIISHTFDASVAKEAANTLRFSNKGWIMVNESCSGLKQFYQILALFFLFPGPIKHKLWFIPVSILIMHATNVMRIVILGMVTLWLPDYWQISHDWILRPFFYVVLFMLWVWWVERFGGFTDYLRRRKQG